MKAFKQVNKEFKKELFDYLGIFVGANLTALALIWFLIPNKIAAGGVSGLATIVYYLWGWPVGLVMLIVNIPLLLACLRIFGPKFGIKTFLGTILLSLAVEYWGGIVHPLTLDPLLASLYGGVLTGIGMGLTFKCHGTTGGTDLAAQLLNHFTQLTIGQGLFLFDGIVIGLAGIIFRSAELMLYALIAVAASGKIIDGVIEGFSYSKGAFIISDHSEKIAQRILEEMNRGVTGLTGRGIYSGKSREVLLCIIGRTEETRLKQLVREEDPRAFVIISNVHEVLGEGFKE